MQDSQISLQGLGLIVTLVHVGGMRGGCYQNTKGSIGRRATGRAKYEPSGARLYLASGTCTAVASERYTKLAGLEW